VYVDTGAMYRTLAWHCLQKSVDVTNEKAVANACRRWTTTLECVEQDGLRAVRLLVDGYFPEAEIRTPETAAAVSNVAAVPGVRKWMKKTQRDCIQFGDLVMEGRDIGTNIFPETDFKFYLDATLAERSARRAADGVNENLAARDQRDSHVGTDQRIAAGGNSRPPGRTASIEDRRWRMAIACFPSSIRNPPSSAYEPLVPSRLADVSRDLRELFPLAGIQSGKRAAARRGDTGLEPRQLY
jgi:cytidylate kinase